jgi:hypothetical protein
MHPQWGRQESRQESSVYAADGFKADGGILIGLFKTTYRLMKHCYRINEALLPD